METVAITLTTLLGVLLFVVVVGGVLTFINNMYSH